MNTDLVVVTTPVKVFRSKPSPSPVVAARFEQLGLTAYGNSKEEAVTSLKKMFNKFIHAYRSEGQLEQRLNQLGVEWCWAKDYPTESQPFEDTNPGAARVGHSPSALEKMTSRKLSERADGVLPLAFAA